MSNFELALWSFPVLLILIFIRIPIALAMLAVGFGGSYLVLGSPLMMMNQLKTLTYGTFSNYSYSIIPLFLLMGQFATLSGMSASLFRAAESFLGHRRGGVAMSAIGACAGFGAICGSSLATAATMGQVALPELRRYGYPGSLSTGALAAGGTLGILIPPSVILVIYAILAEQNIEKLFVAALIPGILAAAGYMLAISIWVRVSPNAATVRPRVPWSERMVALGKVWPVLTIFLVVVGGIYLGVFTPTEAAAVGAAGTGLISLASGQMSWDKLKQAILSTASSTAMIFLIILGAGLYNSFLALTQLPQLSSAWVAEQGLNPWLVLTAVLIMYLVFGCIMDSLSMVLLTVPIIYPIMVVLDFGMSPNDFGLWFGILVLIVVEVGLITPPVGMNLFIINSMARDIPIGQTYRGAMPFVLTDMIRVVILTAFPAITLSLVWLIDYLVP
ncbi:TRAP transporter large permease [Sulfitobacter pseudonitzschiae]|uniref:TRAP transporter large permease protein n=1 Tax=Pseudosulfitobacter pseudonitzschiae TaxID=1402135 RepID=A0A9Q2RWZ5_9RHOB|nr:TRAP transporter large permease [Pseudosulfitobacter pseudonitzschiae]MBM2293950.1 TRAP transporter large permease [Pseudosulfitobacter pseudonitzschiae]MBM2298903.1 TRAP transporter large permease [Pseudosulfitobacter pseudonitzschiae]MBM2303817.1 TRAP transporter large permease [Pseudosulfitobacter pseudonitzschiae]MBM2313564.1 TRAP transporter large permease [Pseudosulfitobacter pseudonitzschiae]MBM2318514.1 TRAP transporter large permease [Pseudosulfitobacter pseudonitzschiae]